VIWLYIIHTAEVASIHRLREVSATEVSVHFPKLTKTGRNYVITLFGWRHCVNENFAVRNALRLNSVRKELYQLKCGLSVFALFRFCSLLFPFSFLIT
jgi:hypothetical protein